MAQQLTPEQQKARFQKLAKIGLAIGAGILFAPVAMYAIGGLIGLGVAATIAVGINLAPVVAQKLANLRMKMIMDEARRHPIETMLVIYTDNMRTIKEADNKIRNLAARLLDFRGKAKDFSEKYPARAKQYEEMINNIQKVLDRWKLRQKNAKIAATLYHDKIDEAQATYEIAKEAAGLQELTGDAEKEVNQNIQKQVAFDEVNHSFNLAIAELSTDMETDPEFDIVKHTNMALDLKANVSSVRTSDLEETRQS